MRSYDELVAEAEAADVTGWGFDWLEGRASEERPGWGYGRQMARRLRDATCALDIDTGGGELVDEAPSLPPHMVVTESWPPNLRQAQHLLGPRGVTVVQTASDAGLPFATGSFDLVTSRHPVWPDWPEIARVVRPDTGRYFAQHVGPASAFELIEYFLGPLPEHRNARDPRREVVAAQQAGLVVDEVRTARCRMEFRDVGAIIWILRKCVWWVPDFTAHRYERQLRALDKQLRAGRPFVAHSTRHLISARRR